MPEVWLAAIGVATLTACGGGGGSTPAAVSTSDYQLRQAWVNYMTLSGTQRFTVSGTLSGVAVSGSGSETDGSLVAATFEGRSALSKTIVVTGSLSGGGQTIPYGSSGVGYVDSNYMPLGQYGLPQGGRNRPHGNQKFEFNHLSISSCDSKL